MQGLGQLYSWYEGILDRPETTPVEGCACATSKKRKLNHAQRVTNDEIERSSPYHTFETSDIRASRENHQNLLASFQEDPGQRSASLHNNVVQRGHQSEFDGADAPQMHISHSGGPAVAADNVFEWDETESHGMEHICLNMAATRTHTQSTHWPRTETVHFQDGMDLLSTVAGERNPSVFPYEGSC